MSRQDTALLVVDVQEKLLPHIRHHRVLVWNIRRLIDAALIIGLPVAGTEQYPQGLGATVGELAGRLGSVPSKLTFSCVGCPQLFDELDRKGVNKLLVVGIEAHVCVQQTVLDLLAAGVDIFVAVDAVGSRNQVDFDTAVRRMESAGATITTTEAAMFEWCGEAGTPEFKDISKLVREVPPDGDPS
jgi:nicotinamidase-related amidase